MFIKIFAYGFVLNRDSYLRDFWNIFDFLIIIATYISFLLDGMVNLAVLRTFRILRPLRTISTI